MRSNEEVLGEILQKYRKKKGWSRSELARRSGYSERFLEYVEAGTKSVTMRTLYRLCAALGCRPSTVLRALESGREAKD